MELALKRLGGPRRLFPSEELFLTCQVCEPLPVRAALKIIQVSSLHSETTA